MCALFSLMIQTQGKSVDANAIQYANKIEKISWFWQTMILFHSIVSAQQCLSSSGLPQHHLDILTFKTLRLARPCLLYHIRGERSWAIIFYIPSAQVGKQDTSSQPTSLCLQQNSLSLLIVISVLHFVEVVKIGLGFGCLNPSHLATPLLLLLPVANKPTLCLNFWIWEQNGQGRELALGGCTNCLLILQRQHLPWEFQNCPYILHAKIVNLCDMLPMLVQKQNIAHVAPDFKRNYTATFKCYFTDSSKGTEHLLLN